MRSAARKADDIPQAVEGTAWYAAARERCRRTAPATEPVELALRLAALLQATLDCETLLAQFSHEISPLVPHDGVAYRSIAHALDIRHGEGSASHHGCTYRLRVEDRDLGEIRFLRRRPFADGELRLLEQLLCGLVYPLRNALDYRQAMENARRDPLTRVYNRLGFEDLLQREIGLARRHGTPLSIAFLDIDRFKSVNDTYGHAVGDNVIRLFVECVVANIRDTDVLARYGGDEFVLLLSNTALEGAVRVAERIRRAVEQRECLLPGGGRLQLTTSIGLAALAPQDGVAQLCEKADCALQRAKHSGRNRVVA